MGARLVCNLSLNPLRHFFEGPWWLGPSTCLLWNERNAYMCLRPWNYFFGVRWTLVSLFLVVRNYDNKSKGTNTTIVHRIRKMEVIIGLVESSQSRSIVTRWELSCCCCSQGRIWGKAGGATAQGTPRGRGLQKGDKIVSEFWQVRNFSFLFLINCRTFTANTFNLTSTERLRETESQREI